MAEYTGFLPMLFAVAALVVPAVLTALIKIERR